jgi:IstB-like ATP binding protein
LLSDWGQVSADQVVASAIIDRLIHNAVVVNIRGRSYPMRAHQDEPASTPGLPAAAAAKEVIEHGRPAPGPVAVVLPAQLRDCSDFVIVSVQNS